MPARTIKSHSLAPKELKENPSNFFKDKLTKTRKTTIIKPLIVVAKVESISLSPIFANIATKAAVMEAKKA